MSVHMWTEDRDRTVMISPSGPVFAKKGQVVVVAVLSAEAGERFLRDMVIREQTEVERRLDLSDAVKK